jgi:hypothetical protein
VTTRMLTRPETIALLQRADMTALRTYDLKVYVVTDVDNQGTQCEYCGEAGALVSVNVYARDMDGQDHCADTCLTCAFNVIDSEIDTDPAQPVIIEIAQGVQR